MYLSLSTGSLYAFPLHVVFRWARAAGFDGVELTVNPEVIARGGHRVRELANAAGLAIFSIHPTLVPIPHWQERNGGMGPTIRLAQETGAGVVVMHTPRSPSLESGEGLAFRQSIERWQPQLMGSGLCLAVENKNIRTETHRQYVLSPLERLRAFADTYDLGLVLDTTHAGTAGVDLVQARRTFDGRLVNVHLSDVGGARLLARLPRMELVLREHRFPGAGELRLVPLLADLAAAGYDGPVTLEVNPIELRVWWPPAVRRHLVRALVWMQNAAGEGQSAANPEPGPTA